MTAFTPIETDRLRIRQFTPDDWPAVHAYTGDARTMHYVEEQPMDETQTRQFITDNMGEEAKHFAVALRDEGRPIGHLAFHPWYSTHTYEIGWVLHPRYHGQGYTTEAAAALLRHGFETLRLHRIIATCQPENPASWRVMEKIGMRREAHFRKGHRLHAEEWWDEYFYAILEEDWFGTETGNGNGNTKEIEENR